jgi:hypothetical protein
MLKIQSFQPNVLIVDHFDQIKNKIDIKTETLLQEEAFKTSESDQKILNELREEQLNKISEIQAKNLSLVEFDENAYQSKWTHVIDNRSMSYEDKVDIIKEELILVDCLLIDDSDFKSGISLFVTPWFFNRNRLEFFK